mmetsp:Transcript_10031/g.27325  ORF Transcript_10031/g.27325 Transcript_10031/m.27325 type:complete len:262 (-) Transcript_10031:1586-2371(-)
MLQRVLEKHQVHALVLCVVELQDALEDGLDVAVVAEVLVQAHRVICLPCQAGHSLTVVAKQDGVSQGVRCAGLKILLHDLCKLAVHHVLIFRADQAVMEHAQRLIAPQAQELLGVGELVGGGEQQALIHSRNVSQVEDVVEARGCGRQLLTDEVVQADRGIRQLLANELSDAFSGQLVEVRGQDSLVNGAQILAGWELDLEDVEEAHESGVDRVARPTGRAHGGNNLHILDVLPAQILAAVVHAPALDEELQESNGLLCAV